MKDAKVTGLGDDVVVIAPGDSIDVGPDGVIVWLSDEDAKAWRLQQRKRQREVRQMLAGRPEARA